MAIALLNLSDDHGYFNANPAVVRGEVFPFEESLARVSRALDELSRVGYIAIGTTAAGRRVGNVVNFKLHQRVDHPSRLTFDVDSIIWDGKTSEPSRDSREILASPRESLDNEHGAGSMERGAGSMEKEPKRRKERKANFSPDEFDSLLPENFASSPEFIESWHDWNSHRYEKGERITPTGAKAQIKKISSLQVAAAIETIQSSIAGGWSGLFPKGDNNNRSYRQSAQTARALPTC